MVRVQKEIVIRAPRETIATELFRVEAFPEYMDDVKEVKILERHKDHQISAWKVEIDGVELNWVEEDFLSLPVDRPEGHLYYKILEGDFEKFEGSWMFSPAAEGEPASRVQLTVDYDLGLPHFDELLGEMLEVKVKRNAASLLRALKERAEGRR